MASWVRILHDRDYTHKSRAVTAYKRGDVVYVPDHIGGALIHDGDAELTEKPARKTEAEDRNDMLLMDRINADDNG